VKQWRTKKISRRLSGAKLDLCLFSV